MRQLTVAVTVLLALLTPAVAVAGPTGADAAEPEEAKAAARPIAARVKPAGELVPGRYIVTLRSETVLTHVLELVGISPVHDFEHVLDGFAARLTPEKVRALRRMPSVTRVEQDSVVRARVGWNLDRLNQRGLPLDGVYSTDATGRGVTVYVLGSGIDASHPDFGGRAANVHDATGKGGGACDGHGTHVAGIVGGARYGVAKKAQLRGVRVLGCDGAGTLSDLIAGLDWVAAHADGPAVANVSVGTSHSRSLNEAASALVDSGVLVTAAAGNKGTSACADSPTSASGVLTVAASNRRDHVPTWSNHGRCVDLYAPGVSIASDWLNGKSRTRSGTSMAAPHAAGVAALYLDTHPDATPRAVNRWLRRHALRGVLSGVPRNTPNLLLNTGTL